EECIVLKKCDILSLLDISKIKYEIKTDPSFSAKDSLEFIVKELDAELLKWKICLSVEFLAKYIDYKRSNFLYKSFAFEPHPSNYQQCKYDKPEFAQGHQFKYLNISDLKKLIEERYQNQITAYAFITKVLQNCVNWNTITSMLKKEVTEHYKKAKLADIIKL